MLSGRYARSVAERLRREFGGSGETTHLSVMDAEGNAPRLRRRLHRRRLPAELKLPSHRLPRCSVSHSVRIATKSGANSRFSLAYSLTLPVTASWKR